jgi:hypothetical protein
MESKFTLPTETVELPSKGLLYPKESPLSKGEVEMKYMTAKEEDILTNANYITKGNVIDKLVESLLVDKTINIDDILIGDKNALMIAVRLLSYGKDYNIKYGNESIVVDLTKLKHVKVDYSLFQEGKNEFEFKLPNTDNIVTIKCLSTKDETLISKEIEGNQKINKERNTSSTSRLKHLITSVNGLKETKDIREFVDKFLLAKDARAIRTFYKSINPDIDLTYTFTNSMGGEEDVIVPIGLDFFWPDA